MSGRIGTARAHLAPLMVVALLASAIAGRAFAAGAAAAAHPADTSAYAAVDPFIGTGGEGHTFHGGR